MNYINDLTEFVNSNIRLFADDTILYAFVDNPVIAADALNYDLNSLMIWANQWLVELKYKPDRRSLEKLYFSYV